MDGNGYGFWAFAATALGGGAVGTISAQLFNYFTARAKQPVQEYDQLAKSLREIIERDRQHYEAILVNERAHYEARVKRLETIIDAQDERERLMLREIGELNGRLNEQRRLLEVVIHKAEATDASSLLGNTQVPTPIVPPAKP
jgi:phage shock protein A